MIKLEMVMIVLFVTRVFLSVWQKKTWTWFLSLFRGWIMLDLSKIEDIYLAPGATDLRKSIDGCSNIVQYQMFLDPFSPSIFIFCNRTKTTIKVLEWYGNRFWLHKKNGLVRIASNGLNQKKKRVCWLIKGNCHGCWMALKLNRNMLITK